MPYNNYLHTRLLPILLISCLFSSCQYFSSSPAREEVIDTADVVYTEKKDSVEDTHLMKKPCGNSELGDLAIRSKPIANYYINILL